MGAEPADTATVFCRDCGEEISARAEICPECGIRQQEPPSSDKSQGLAAVFSFVIPGLGQVYKGQLAKGIILGAITIGLAITGAGLILAVPIWIWLIYDAYKPPKGSKGSSADRHIETPDDAKEPPEIVDYVLGWYLKNVEDDQDVRDARARLGRVGLGRLWAEEAELAIRAIDTYEEEAGDIETAHARQALVQQREAAR